MMTPSELREYEFKGAGRNAYKADDVDIFFGEVAVAYEKLFRENAELVKRISLLADRLEQFKNDEDQIKQAVIGAQKAADIIIKEAEASVEDSKIEAESILAAAKGEADIIKSDAEKQAIADSDLLLSIARDKAEDIINKAKEEAHGILIEANDSAKDTVGAATRTITSESIHYEMLKKEVSDFRASILAQYKAHIEMISKLPELAVEEAEKQTEEIDDASEDIVEEINSVDPENDIIEFIEVTEDEENSVPAFEEDEEENEEEEVVKTTLPYDFFSEESTMEFVEDEAEEEQIPDINEFNEAFENEDVDVEAITEEADGASESDIEEATEEEPEEEKPVSEDIPISRGFSINTESVDESVNAFSSINEGKQIPSMFSSFETIDDEDEAEEEAKEEPKKRFGFFRKK